MLNQCAHSLRFNFSLNERLNCGTQLAKLNRNYGVAGLVARGKYPRGFLIIVHGVGDAGSRSRPCIRKHNRNKFAGVDCEASLVAMCFDDFGCCIRPWEWLRLGAGHNVTSGSCHGPQQRGDSERDRDSD